MPTTGTDAACTECVHDDSRRDKHQDDVVATLTAVVLYRAVCFIRVLRRSDRGHTDTYAHLTMAVQCAEHVNSAHPDNPGYSIKYHARTEVHAKEVVEGPEY